MKRSNDYNEIDKILDEILYGEGLLEEIGANDSLYYSTKDISRMDFSDGETVLYGTKIA